MVYLFLGAYTMGLINYENKPWREERVIPQITDFNQSVQFIKLTELDQVTGYKLDQVQGLCT